MPLEQEHAGFVVDLEAYSGPLDLLLSLIRRDEVDIFDIPIARITDQYLAALDELRGNRVEIAGEFMVLAATLMQIKSKMLLPRPAPLPGQDENEEDPRRELVQMLLDYQQYQEAAELLEGLSAARRRFFEAPGETLDTGPRELVDPSVMALVRAYERVMQEAVEPEPPRLRDARYSVREQVEWVLARLAAGPCPFGALFLARPTRVEVVVTFMAVLELIATARVRAQQDGLFEEIVIRRVDP